MSRRGVTLIELLVVLALIGLVAGIALPRLFHVKERAQVAAMLSDLRNLVTMEESYLAEHQMYTTNLGPDYHVSGGNRPPVITLTAGGWTATITSTVTDQQCAVYVGATAAPPATKEGSPACAATGSSATPLP